MDRLKIYLTGSGLGATLVRAAIGSTGLQIVGMGLGFLVGVQLARGVGVEGYGVYSFGMSVAALLGIPTEFGLPQLVSREVSTASVRHDWAQMRGVMIFSTSAIAVSALVMALLGELILWATPLVSDPEQRATLRWGLLLVPLAGQTKLCGVALQGLGQVVLGQLPNYVLRPGFFALALFFAAFWFAPRLQPSVAMGLQVAGTALALVTAAVLLARFVPAGARAAKAEYHTKSWLASAFPMALTDCLRVLQGNMAVLLLGLLSNTEQIGLFRVADSTSAMLGFPISMLSAIVISMIPRLWAARETSKLSRLLLATAIAMSAGVAVLTIPVLIAGPSLLGLLFGPAFADAYPTLMISCSANFAIAAFGAGGIVLNMTGHEKRVTRAFAFSVTANLLISLACIPFFGASGAAMGNAAAAAVWSTLLWLDVRRLTKLDASIFAVLQMNWRMKTT